MTNNQRNLGKREVDLLERGIHDAFMDGFEAAANLALNRREVMNCRSRAWERSECFKTIREIASMHGKS